MPSLDDLNSRASGLDRCLAWQSLHEHAREAAGWALGDLLDAPGRYRAFSRKLNGVLLDFSRNRVREETISLLLRLARERDLKDWIQYLFAGAKH